MFYDTYVEIEKITDGAEYMGPANTDGGANAEEDEDDEEEYVGEVVDPAAPMETNEVQQNVPQAPSPPAEKTVRGVGRPQYRPPPVAHKHSLAAFFTSGPKRPREEAIDVEPQVATEVESN